MVATTGGTLLANGVTEGANVTNTAATPTSLGEAAYRHLRADIVTCRLAPGQRVTERQLAADTGFGVSPLRDALTRLDHEGLVETLPRKGYRVTSMTPKSIDDLFVAWEIIGPELVRQGIANANDDQLAEALKGFDLVDEVRRGEPGLDTALRVVDTSNHTFRVLAEATGNDYLIAIFQRLTGDIGRVSALLLMADPKVNHSLSERDRHAVSIRDADAAADNALRYIRQTRIDALKVVTRWPSIMTSEVQVPTVR